jgi:hypothetical protein
MLSPQLLAAPDFELVAVGDDKVRGGQCDMIRCGADPDHLAHSLRVGYACWLCGRHADRLRSIIAARAVA